MTEDEVRQNAFAMPITSPAYPKGPYRFYDREFLIVTYRTDPERLQKMIPAPLKFVEPLVHYEFIRMPDSNGFGDYTESGQVIPVEFEGQRGSYVHAMYLDDEPPISGGRELWGFPKKFAHPKLAVHKETLVGTLDFGPLRVVNATMGYKHRDLDTGEVARSLTVPNFLLKIVPHVDGSPRICEIVKYHMTDITVKGAWGGPGGLELFHHALAPVAELPVLEIVGAKHILSDLTLALGEVVFDYLA